jgi:exopolysaccharide production protein ExoQ
LIEENPILGTGLQAFWVEGNPYAEEIWARYDQARTGFHFHNLWYETAVQLGYVGVAVAFVTVSAATIEVGRWVLRSPKPESSFFFAFVVFTDVRTYLEVDLFGQFFFSWVLFLVAWSYARQARLKARGELRRSGPTFPRPGSTGG